MAGIYASNHDVTHVFVDSALKICGEDMNQFAGFVKRTAALGEANGIEFIMTSSIPVDEIPEELQKYVYSI